MWSQLRCARHARSQRRSLRGTSLMVVSFLVVVVVPGCCLHGMDVETWTSLKHEGKLGSRDWCIGMLVSVDLDRCALILASLTVRAMMAALASSSLSLPTPKTRVSGKVPHAWPDVRQGRIRWAETFPRQSLLARRVSLSNCVELYAVI